MTAVLALPSTVRIVGTAPRCILTLETNPANTSIRQPLPLRVSAFLSTIKFEHSIFALPFAVAAAFMVADGVPDLLTAAWLLLAMVALRTFAMGANRLVDAELDRRNPRTADRPTATGAVPRRDVWVWMVATALLFVVAALNLHPLALWLSPIPIVVAAGYPYLKRFTWLAHFGIGAVYVIIPPAVSIAMTGQLPLEYVALGVAAMFWVSGFDMLYAISDMEFDRASGLHSIPARFGITGALVASRVCHVFTVIVLILALYLGDAGWIGYLGAVAVAGLLLYEQMLVSSDDLSKLNAAFFTMNGIIAVVLAAFIVADVLV